MNIVGLTFIGAGISLIVMVAISFEVGAVGIGTCAIAYGIIRLKQNKEVRNEGNRRNTGSTGHS